MWRLVQRAWNVMCLTMSLVVPNASLLSLTLSHPHALSSCHAHIFVLLAHMQTHSTFLPALPTLQILTDSDVEAVNAEGGTPTLPKTMLLGVSFHRFGTVQSHLCLLMCFNASRCSCSVLFQFRFGNSPPGEKKNVVLWLRLVLSASGELSHHFLLQTPSWRISFKSFSTPLCLLCISFLSLSPFSHLNKLGLWLLIWFSSLFLPPPLPPCFLSTSLFPKRYSRCVWWVAVVVVVVVVDGRRGHLQRSFNERDFCQEFITKALEAQSLYSLL